MKWIRRLMHSTVFLGWMVAILFTTSLAATGWAIHAAYTAATVAAGAAAAAAAHRREIARLAAKARLRRMIVAVPVLGGGAAVYFERQEYAEWREANPDGTAAEYGCFVAAATGEVMDEVLQDLPQRVRPSPDRVRSMLPDCPDDGVR